MEIDEFDVLRPVHLLNRSTNGRIQGCVRLLPSTGPTMLRDTFPILLDGQAAPRSQDIWESSRFALDVSPDAPKGHGGLAGATYECFCSYDRIWHIHSAERDRDRHRRPHGTNSSARRLAPSHENHGRSETPRPWQAA